MNAIPHRLLASALVLAIATEYPANALSLRCRYPVFRSLASQGLFSGEALAGQSLQPRQTLLQPKPKIAESKAISRLRARDLPIVGRFFSTDEMEDVLRFLRSLGYTVKTEDMDLNVNQRAMVGNFSGFRYVYFETTPLELMVDLMDFGLSLEGRKRLIAEIMRRYPGWTGSNSQSLTHTPPPDPRLSTEEQAARFEMLRRTFLQELVDGTLNSAIGPHGVATNQIHEFLVRTGATFDQLRQLVGEPLRSFSELAEGDLVIVYSSFREPGAMPATVRKVHRKRFVEVLQAEAYLGRGVGDGFYLRPEDVIRLATAEEVAEIRKTGRPPSGPFLPPPTAPNKLRDRPTNEPKRLMGTVKRILGSA